MKYNKIEEFTTFDFISSCFEEMRYYDEESSERRVGAEFTHKVITFQPRAFELCNDYKKAQDKAKEIYDILLKFANMLFKVKNKQYKILPDIYSDSFILLIGFDMEPKGVCDEF